MKPESKTPDASCPVVGYGVLIQNPVDGEWEWDSCWEEAWAANDHLNDVIVRLHDAEQPVGESHIIPLVRQSDHLAKVAELEAVIAAKTAALNEMNK